jgi:hypothetical protein
MPDVKVKHILKARPLTSRHGKNVKEARKIQRDTRVAGGQPVSRRTCPGCVRAVPGVLPNGVRKACAIEAFETALPHPAIPQALEAPGTGMAAKVCLACADTIRDLVGTLIRPPGGEGDALSSPGLNDTGILGAVVPREGGATVPILTWWTVR